MLIYLYIFSLLYGTYTLSLFAYMEKTEMKRNDEDILVTFSSYFERNDC